ncbi:serine hydrolase [Agrobacterium sp. a22-2]|uniref:serine hydrolase domain-containing protein n=1 Tax=Agrobacterium sp. a22-2 TaxID=2283840 RepID=UPI0014467EE1|nr:serine hydrolase [Agrobacterium sp. a22-2]NKN36187.1 serine hydrolase [Agrobacterium sp. a22-2]
MRVVRLVLQGFVLVFVMLLVGVIAWLSVAPPELLRVGTGYAAKIVCSNVFLAKRDGAQVLAQDVQAPGHPLLRTVHVDVDREQGSVTARLLRVFVPATAVYREGLGCVSVADGDLETVLAAPPAALPPLPKPAAGPWPAGGDSAANDPRLASVLGDRDLTGSGMRAVVIIKDGQLAGEAYGPDFDRDTPLLGWSIAKTVNAAILGRAVAEGRIDLEAKGVFAEWSDDARASITPTDLMAMQSGLQFNEDYGGVADVTRMLYLEPDMAAFAAAMPSIASPGAAFNYSSGTSVMLARLWMNTFEDPAAALAYPRTALFGPLGMTSAVMETDQAGTFVASSYLYATAPDWARFGQFLLQDGEWNGVRLLPAGFVQSMQAPSRASGGRYTNGQAWQVGPGDEPDGRFGLPGDTYWAQGHDGQSIAIVPSERLVVVRLGLTPYSVGYRPQPLVKAVIDALK